MKKKFIAAGLISVALLAGCSANNNASSNDSNTKTGQTDSGTAYQKLSKSDQKNVKFTVSKEDTSTDATAMHDLSITVENKTKKTISLNKSKFVLLINGNASQDSQVKGIISLKSGQQIKFVKVFTDVAGYALANNELSIQYINKKNIIAKPDLSGDVNGDSSSNNASSNNSSQSNNQTDNSSSKDSDASSDSNAVVKRADQAEDLFRRATGSWGGGLSVTKDNGGWNIYGDGKLTGTVSDSGDITNINYDGSQTVTTYNEILHAQQNGGPVKP